jgi:hypothetical protein
MYAGGRRFPGGAGKGVNIKSYALFNIYVRETVSVGLPTGWK